MLTQPSTTSIVDTLVARYPELLPLTTRLTQAADMICACHQRDGLVLICGNGGSAADSAHIVGELMKGFMLPRTPNAAQHACLTAAGCPDGLQRGVRAIDLTAQIALLLAVANDLSVDSTFAQQVFAYGRPGDVLVVLSTSGNARNVVRAAQTAQALGLQTIGFTGIQGGDVAPYCNLLLNVPATETYLVQELHLPLYHALCAMVETKLFGDEVPSC
ncbi:MAG: SIS domain-containing protein [bacterium]